MAVVRDLAAAERALAGLDRRLFRASAAALLVLVAGAGIAQFGGLSLGTSFTVLGMTIMLMLPVLALVGGLALTLPIAAFIVASRDDADAPPSRGLRRLAIAAACLLFVFGVLLAVGERRVVGSGAALAIVAAGLVVHGVRGRDLIAGAAPPHRSWWLWVVLTGAMLFSWLAFDVDATAAPDPGGTVVALALLLALPVSGALVWFVSRRAESAQPAQPAQPARRAAGANQPVDPAEAVGAAVASGRLDLACELLRAALEHGGPEAELLRMRIWTHDWRALDGDATYRELAQEFGLAREPVYRA